MSVSEHLLSFVKTTREGINGGLASIENGAIRPASEGFVSRLRPLYTQLSYASTRLPVIREKYPSLLVGSAITLFSVPTLITRGRLPGVIVGGIAGGVVGVGLKVADFLDGKD
ncbi:hypothetical protein TrLO_g15393 [Triparma laevis f. longispina]|uniref:Uncharacterized protein n=1 Tax=Triparma laevis f. longispina TaxID=1714387 RepID=A0A9W7FA61_9STRA|nr:hypothetical protein TrLO_g15393 [Triparma laevis f. longispina]